MTELNLYKVWELCNKLSQIESLLGTRSLYYEKNFEDFLEEYSFKIDLNHTRIIIFNDDKIAMEDFSNDDFSYIPIVLLTMTDKEVDAWIDDEVIKMQETEKLRKLQEKESLERRISILKSQLESGDL